MPSIDGERFHDPQKPGHHSCVYGDTMKPLAWFAFQRPDVMQEYRSSHPDARVNTAEEWGRWLISLSRVKTPRLYEFMIWFDKRQATIPGRWSARGSENL